MLLVSCAKHQVLAELWCSNREEESCLPHGIRGACPERVDELCLHVRVGTLSLAPYVH